MQPAIECKDDNDCANDYRCRIEGDPADPCASKCVVPAVKGEICASGTDDGGNRCRDDFQVSCGEGSRCAIEVRAEDLTAVCVNVCIDDDECPVDQRCIPNACPFKEPFDSCEVIVPPGGACEPDVCQRHAQCAPPLTCDGESLTCR